MMQDSTNSTNYVIKHSIILNKYYYHLFKSWSDKLDFINLSTLLKREREREREREKGYYYRWTSYLRK